MSSLRLLLALSACLILPAAALDGRGSDATQEQGSETRSLCLRLVNEAREIDKLLHTVSDKPSADHAAVILRDKLDLMRTLLKRLEKEPPPTASDARMLDQQMSTLTHITQGYILTMQRLTEVNAYGSDDLLEVFRNYKMSSRQATSSTQGEDLPQSRLYIAMGDQLEDMLYLLRKVQNQEGAARASEALGPALEQTLRLRQMLENLSPAQPTEQREAIRPAKERLRRLCDELKREQERLRAAGYYGESSLGPALEQYGDAIH